MKAKNIYINGISLENILQEYNNVQILIQYAKDTKEFGGNKALWNWDEARAKTIIKDIQLEIK